jgi:hypothetical protein
MLRGTLLTIPLALTLALAPGSALAKNGDDGGRQEVRVAGACGKGATAALRLRQRDGIIRAQLEIQHTRSAASWRVVLVQEGRVVYRGRARTSAGAFEVERRLSDLPGADRVTARAVGPRGLTCVAAATLSG